ncbi:hypothetical protein C8Q78DRAFT_998992 [Trametes maxima]|nr:hypothetical protein C8Q78DRAFT_998992 [Trametes maxima]
MSAGCEPCTCIDPGSWKEGGGTQIPRARGDVPALRLPTRLGQETRKACEGEREAYRSIGDPPPMLRLYRPVDCERRAGTSLCTYPTGMRKQRETGTEREGRMHGDNATLRRGRGGPRPRASIVQGLPARPTLPVVEILEKTDGRADRSGVTKRPAGLGASVPGTGRMTMSRAVARGSAYREIRRLSPVSTPDARKQFAGVRCTT